MSLNSFNRECYLTWLHYVAFKQYFSSWEFEWNYDRVVLGNMTPQSFFKRKDVQAFALFVDTVDNLRQRQDIMVSAFIKNSESYVRDMTHMPDWLTDFHNSRMSVIYSLRHFVGKDLDNIEEYCYNEKISFVDILKVNETNLTPIIVKEAGLIGINLETLSLINNFFNYTRFESMSPLWNKNRLKIAKYGQLLDFDKAYLKTRFNHLLKLQQS